MCVRAENMSLHVSKVTSAVPQLLALKINVVRGQCDLLKSLQAATTPHKSFISTPRVGVANLELLPYSLFPP